MDSGILIALVTVVGSFLTVCTTSLVNIWSKWIDSKQKIDEHKLSIRSTYITKKIEAGQSFVSKNSRMINKLNLYDQYWMNIKLFYNKDENLIKNIFEYEEISFKKTLEYDDWTHLYYDLEDYYDQSYRAIDNINCLANKYNKIFNSYDCNEESINNVLDEISNAISALQELYRTMNKIVRDDLAKYDLI